MFTALALTLSAFAGPQDAGPSFDCARATTVVERVICADPELGRLDRRMSARFAILRRELGATTRAALLDDQRGYLWARDERFEAMPASERLHYLRMNLRSRAEFLDAVSTEPRIGLAGLWSNFMGVVFVSPVSDRKILVEAQAAEPTTGRWTCDFRVNARLEGDTAHGDPTDTPDQEIGDHWAINLERRGALLTLEECCQAGHCGNGGTISGLYLPLDGGLPSYIRDHAGS